MTDENIITNSSATSNLTSFKETSNLDANMTSLQQPQNECTNNNFFEPECNKFLLKKELIEHTHTIDNENSKENDYLYPTLNDANFNVKIAQKKEFNDNKYDGPDFTKSIKEQADLLANADYELAPHQVFVKSFLSFQTPYSSSLLYHGLGSGKTCSAIGVCEEMRDYMKQVGLSKRIIIVASENVQDNFKLQLFDERKLKEINGIWSMRGCVGNKLLKEINPMNVPMSKEKVISQIKNLINTYYIFLGYVQFANYIVKTMNYEEEVKKQREKNVKKVPSKNKIQILKDVKVELNSRIIRRLRNEFNNRLIVIDEVHNIRKTEDNDNKKVAINLEYLVKSAENMRFLLLSATPMYNNYKEIIWLLNLMNTNDRRGRIEVKDVFDKYGNFKEGGQELLVRKATGYISFVRGENPYTFPYRVYPNEFSKSNTFDTVKYPEYQMNMKRIKHEDKIATAKPVLSLYLTKIGECNDCGKCQYCCYKYIIHHLRKKNFSVATKHGVMRNMPSFANMGSFGYTLLLTPIESLIISYPISGLNNILKELPEIEYSNDFSPSFDEEVEEKVAEVEETAGPIDESDVDESEIQETKTIGGASPTTQNKLLIDPHQLTGKGGIERMMNFVDSKSPAFKGNYKYKPTTLNNFGKIFSHEEIGNYSMKIKTILDMIYNTETNRVSDGIILIYSQYIDSGLIPMALALEEMGFTRFGQTGIKPLFKNRPSEVVDSRTMQIPENKNNFMPARYSMITGDPRLSPDNDLEVKGLTGDDNIDGHKVKVVLISKAGSEGIDFKYIRQVHILDPWYNLNRIEQIIGRGVRNFSHKDLPFEKRNVQIFLHATILDKNIEEAADLYIYRIAEYKAKQIGKVSRVLKETSYDCIINHDQTLFTQKNMSKYLKENLTQELSSGQILKDYKVGDVPFSPACDYMEDCNYSCRPDASIDEDDLNEDTYNESFISMNAEKILQNIRMLFKTSFFYKKDTLLQLIRKTKEYPYVQIYSALTQLINDENEFIMDKYGRNGRLINIGEYYLFQPLELGNKNVSIFERSVPLDYKHNMIKFELKELTKKDANVAENEILRQEQAENGILFPDGKRVLDEMSLNYEITKDYIQKGKVPRGDDNWYKHSGIVIIKMQEDYPDSSEYLMYLLVSHIIETLLFDDKINLMNYLYSLDTMEDDTIEKYAKDYFNNHTIATKNYNAFIGYNLDKRMIMMQDEKNIWVETTPEDMKEIAMSQETKKYLEFKIEDFNTIVGFLGYEKGNGNLVFKTKNMLSKRDTGARCDEAGKSKNKSKLNDIVGEEKYTTENMKQIGNTELCVLEEFILRYFHETNRNNKKWFLDPEMAIYHKLYNVLK